MKAVVAAFNQEKALVGTFSVITNLRMQLFEALVFKRCHAVMEEWSLGIGPILTVFSWLVAVTDADTRTMSHVAQWSRIFTAAR